MAFNRRRTYLAYNNQDLIRDGFIPTSITKFYDVGEFNFNRLRNPRKGIQYAVNANGSVNEIKKLLPVV